MDEANEPNPQAYGSLNALFTRDLKDSARPVNKDANAMLCPADGVLSEYGQMKDGQLLQAKGHSYSATDLLGGDSDRAAAFSSGSFATVYLAPHNYHRVHAPVSGLLREMHHVPGKLFSVSLLTARTVPNLFARNERVVTVFDTDRGKVAVVLVGAMGVGDIETVWHGAVKPSAQKLTSSPLTSWLYPQNASNKVELNAGDELGRFNLGSTVVMLFEKPILWQENIAGSDVKMAQQLGSFSP